MSDPVTESVSERILRSMSEGVTIVDSTQPNLPIVRTNQAFLEISGYDESEVLGNSLALLARESSSEEDWAQVQEALESGEPLETEIEAVRKDGELFWDRLTVEPAEDGPNQGDRLIVFHQDVTEHNQLTQTLQESQSKLEGYLNVLPDQLMVYNGDGEIVDIHSGNPDFLTRPIEEQKGGNISEDYPEEMVPEVLDTIEQVLETGEPTSLTYRIEIDREPRWFEAHVSAYPRVDREDVVLWLTRDVTEWIQLEQKREEREQRLQLALEGANAGFWELDLETGDEYWDDNLCEMYGVEPENQPIAYEKFLELLHPEDRDEILQTETNLTANMKYQHEYRIGRRDEYRWFQARGRVLCDRNGEPDRVVGISMDVTEEKQARRDLRLLRETLDQSPDLCLFIDPETGQFQDVLGRIEESLGYTREELQTLSVEDIDARVENDLDRQNIVDQLKEQETMTFESIHRDKDGNEFPVQLRAVYIQLEEMDRIVSIARDITERKARSQQFQQMAENIKELFYIKDLEQNEYTYVSPAIETILGHSPEDLLHDSPDTWLQWIHPSDQKRVEKTLPAQQTGKFDEQYRILHSDGDVRWIQDKAFPVDRSSNGKVTKIVGVAQDITEQMELREQLEQQALHDSLTELPNRTLFEDRLEMAINRCERRESWPFAVVYFDLNNFKEVNDTYGHSFGDQLLQQMGTKLQELVRDEDTVARFGGDEFLILLETIENREDISHFLGRLQEFFQEPFSIEGREIRISTSIGVDLATRDNHEPEELIRNADSAMFHAKQSDSTSVRFYEDDLRMSTKRSRLLHSELETAFQENQFVLYFQPIVDLSTDRIEGLEALVRWEHPEEGLLLPGDFLSAALQSTTLPDMDRHVIRKVCSFIERERELFQDNNLNWISVNVTPQFFLQADATEWIIEQLSERGLDPGNFYIEVTEKTAVQKLEMGTDNLHKFEQSGLRLAVDDFGSGYSSLINVMKLPVSVLKIDH